MPYYGHHSSGWGAPARVNRWLHRVGTARRVGRYCSVAFQPLRCAGCDGRCGLALGAGDELPVAADLLDGTTVDVVASPRTFMVRSFAVFGWPVGAAAASAVFVEWLGMAEIVVVGAWFGAVVAVAGLRIAGAGRDRSAGAIPASVGPRGDIRVVLR